MGKAVADSESSPAQRLALIRVTHEAGNGLSRGDIGVLLGLIEAKDAEIASLRSQVEEVAGLDEKFSSQVVIAGEILRVAKRLAAEKLDGASRPLDECEKDFLQVIDRVEREAPNLLSMDIAQILREAAVDKA